MPAPTLAFSLFASGALILLTLVGFLTYLVVRYGPVISRIFEDRPVFLPLQITPDDLGEPVDFTTEDGLRLSGSYFPRRSRERTGLLVFCHEYLSDRWGCLPYLDHLRDGGYDLFSFDFRNHGTSESATRRILQYSGRPTMRSAT